MNKTRITINPDWLEFILVGELKDFRIEGEYMIFAAGFVLKNCFHGTKHFSNMYDVYFEGFNFGTLRTDPRNTEIMCAEWQQFKLYNERLYEKGYIKLCKLFFQAIGSKVRNLSRLDIAADGFGYMKLMKQFDSGYIEKIGKAKYTLYKDTHRNIEGFDLGSKASDKSITGYKKAATLEKSNKHYIREFWKKSELPGWESENVERLELRLRNNAIIKIEGFDWTRLEDPVYLAGVMKKQMENYFDFRNTLYSNVSRAKKIEFINWESVKAERLEFSKAKRSTEYNRLKQTAKTMYWLYMGTKRKYYLQVCIEIVENLNCVIWFMDKHKLWERQFIKIQSKKGFDYIPVWKIIKENDQLILTERKEFTTFGIC